MRQVLELAERGLLPDALLRFGVRRLVRRRLREIRSAPEETAAVLDELGSGPLATGTGAANAQHYEVPPEFFELVLGPWLKYSCGSWPLGVNSLHEAEVAALELVCERAGIEDGMEVLDIGCGWGSLALWIAEWYPRCRVTAMSNSRSQGDFIREMARARGLDGVTVRTADLNDFGPGRKFDRIVSVEMIEHVRNWNLLCRRLARWLRPGGRVFLHHFCHRTTPYLFEDRGPGDWIARHFFTGGVMPSERLLDRFAGPLELERRWRIGGNHYARTAEAWLENLDRYREEARAVFEDAPGDDPDRWIGRWRLFFLACSGTFGHDRGREWFVSHSRWRLPTGGAGSRARGSRSR